MQYIHAPMGVNATWELINALTPAVPFMGRVVDLVETEYDLKHSSKHSLPNEKTDVNGLCKRYVNSSIFEYKKDRSRRHNCPEISDMLSEGFHALNDTKWLEDWYERRRAHLEHTNTEEIYNAHETSVVEMPEPLYVIGDDPIQACSYNGDDWSDKDSS